MTDNTNKCQTNQYKKVGSFWQDSSGGDKMEEQDCDLPAVHDRGWPSSL